MKAVTRDQLQSRKEQAVRFTRDVLGDPERAEEIADESLDDYADRRKIQITNPTIRRTAIMARGKTKAELEADIEELQAENQELQDQLVWAMTPGSIPRSPQTSAGTVSGLRSMSTRIQASANVRMRQNCCKTQFWFINGVNWSEGSC